MATSATSTDPAADLAPAVYLRYWLQANSRFWIDDGKDDAYMNLTTVSVLVLNRRPILRI